ncbi:hypothetical protein BKA70DRAFT_1426119 [Coprinopsis sp. MPI-PUGE-AT-0042]|nr:hypothetical protein BKA70DRAFT_1440907 [Coprinopsis sp. MPI-PUGE-AT-0042]KAH6909704.1 hypothetical protein BKA70DRAFT_1426119 [Coprinopsis sp. MPI-PUGE-AT-0042]
MSDNPSSTPFVSSHSFLSHFRIEPREKAADKGLASIQSPRAESKKAPALTLSHSVQHLEPPETRSSTSLRSNDNFHLSLDTRFTPLSPPFCQHFAKSPPVRIGDLEMNMNPSTRLPFDPGLEQTWRLESAGARVHHQRRYKIPLSLLHPIASFLSADT